VSKGLQLNPWKGNTMRKLAIRFTAALASLLAIFGALGDGSHQAGHSANRAEQTLPRYEARFGRSQPVIAVVAHNPSTEITDFVVPYGVLSESGVAAVVAVTTGAGPIQTSAGPRFGGHATLAQFDARYPDGADYVIVPAIYGGEDHAPLLDWLRQQAGRGATIVGICDGVRTVANTGLLEGRPATTHWRSIDELQRRHPGTRWTRNSRYIADGRFITTSGVSASIPVSIALVEAIAGRARAQAVAKTLGATDWSARHNSEQFRATASTYVTGLGNKAMFWKHEELGVYITPDVDEIRVALIADVYHRTRRSTTLVVSDSTEPVRTRRGLTIHADRRAGAGEAPDRMLSLLKHVPPVQALDQALSDIAVGYGTRTAALVALSMEYEWKGAGAVRPSSRDFGLGPRPSAKQVYTARLEPRQPVRVRELMTIPVRIADAQGRPLEGARISVDGGMPEHGHGLPTHPRVSRALGDGVYEIQGVRFNMRGWWELKLAIESPAGADSVTFNLSL
jgi:transcriptional regulator GlxA family with amidase domain